MTLKLIRYKYGPGEATLGMLYLENTFMCYTLEDEVRRVKIPGETCIPEGVYDLILRTWGGFHDRYLVRFPAFHKGMIEIKSVPGFSDVLIHLGNKAGDTRGCLLVGAGVMLGDGSGTEDALISSESAYRELYPAIIEDVERGNARLVIHHLEV